MKLFDVYPLYNINIVKGDGCKVWCYNVIPCMRNSLKCIS